MHAATIIEARVRFIDMGLLLTRRSRAFMRLVVAYHLIAADSGEGLPDGGID